MHIIKKSTSKPTKREKSKEAPKKQKLLTEEELKEKQDKIGIKRRGVFIKPK